jgi:hypothetical protein
LINVMAALQYPAILIVPQFWSNFNGSDNSRPKMENITINSRIKKATTYQFIVLFYCLPVSYMKIWVSYTLDSKNAWHAKKISFVSTVPVFPIFESTVP